MANCFCGSGKKEGRCHKGMAANSIVAEVVLTYKKLDEYDFPSCPHYCHQCCFDYFFVSELEFFLIFWYLKEKKDISFFQHIVSRAKLQRRILQEEFPQKYEELNHVLFGAHQVSKDIEHIFDDRLSGKTISLSCACPFLDEKGKCSIYPVRPVICRIYGSILVGTEYNDYMRCDKTGDYLRLTENDLKKVQSLGQIGKYYTRPYPLLEWFAVLAQSSIMQAKAVKAYRLSKEDFLKSIE